MATSKKVTPQPPKAQPVEKLYCVVCHQPWPGGPYRSSEEQQRRVSAACGAKGSIEEATLDIEHLLFAAKCVLNDNTEDGTTEEHRRWVIDTLLEFAQGACEALKESTEALWDETALYLWPTTPRAREAAEVAPEKAADAPESAPF